MSPPFLYLLSMIAGSVIGAVVAGLGGIGFVLLLGDCGSQPCASVAGLTGMALVPPGALAGALLGAFLRWRRDQRGKAR
ncbi:hypothetical protein BKE38_09575 [Pseudoroseomonas deserti]|uniref:Uncharacterized protein n=1 Tax=Teichococcus deserti TaxID=1817963 RepID=A0A1V2H420_9PROT|nr:hypothetical protein [Pseudoroseomonas deserti]ONG54972.1 hypothetical protein BKE38_09575 [Pseudoroseomonas deserti]